MSDHAPIPRVLEILQDGSNDDQVTLTHDGRFLRRKRLMTENGLAFLADFAKATNLRDGTVLVLDNACRVAVRAAPESVTEVRGPLVRLAWHIGNRHTPCQIEEDHLRILHDHVLSDMLTRLGAELREITAPFTPEGGAYGTGRTFSHDHGHD